MLITWINAESMQAACCRFSWCTMANNLEYKQMLHDLCGGFTGTELTDFVLDQIAWFVFDNTTEPRERWADIHELKMIIAREAGYVQYLDSSKLKSVLNK